MFISNNRASFYLWGKENLVKNQKVSIYYETDCRWITLRLKRICDNDEKFTVRSIESKNYLITREYKPKVVEKHFSKICRLSRAEIRQIKSKQQTND